MSNYEAALKLPDGRILNVAELRTLEDWQWERNYRVEFELVETRKKPPKAGKNQGPHNVFAVWVHFNWEAHYGETAIPSTDLLIRMARKRTFRYFSENHFQITWSNHRDIIHLNAFDDS